MHFDRIYGRVISESSTEVVVQDGGQLYKLDRNRMYNSQIVKDMLYTEYADREYEYKSSWPADKRNSGSGNRKRLDQGRHTTN